MMKKVLLIACVAMMVMGLASMASANYLWSFNACTPAGGSFGTATTIGVGTAGAADQTYSVTTSAYAAEVTFNGDGSKAKLLKKDWVSAANDKTSWFVQVWAGADYAAANTTMDFRLWCISSDATGGASAKPFTVKMVYDPTGTIAAGTVLSPNGGVTTATGGSKDAPKFSYNLAAYRTSTPLAANNGYILELTTNTVPEPGSMLAMLSGLVGLVGYGIRRRK